MDGREMWAGVPGAYLHPAALLSHCPIPTPSTPVQSLRNLANPVVSSHLLGLPYHHTAAAVQV